MNLNGFSRVDVEEFNPGFHWLPNSALFLGEPRVILEDFVLVSPRKVNLKRNFFFFSAGG